MNFIGCVSNTIVCEFYYNDSDFLLEQLNQCYQMGENTIDITKQQAKRFLLTYKKLLSPRSLKRKQGIIDYFKQVKSIQYDPLNKVGRNPNLVLQSRIRSYRSCMLEELLYKDRKLINGWDKNCTI